MPSTSPGRELRVAVKLFRRTRLFPRNRTNRTTEAQSMVHGSNVRSEITRRNQFQITTLFFSFLSENSNYYMNPSKKACRESPFCRSLCL